MLFFARIITQCTNVLDMNGTQLLSLALQKMLTGYKNDEIMVFQRNYAKFVMDSIQIFGRHWVFIIVPSRCWLFALCRCLLPYENRFIYFSLLNIDLKKTKYEREKWATLRIGLRWKQSPNKIDWISISLRRDNFVYMHNIAQSNVWSKKKVDK